MYITGMRLLKSIVCVLLMLSLVGCAVSRNPNPMIRYALNTGTTLAGPGMAALCFAGAISDEDHPDEEADMIAGFGLLGIAAGFTTGFVLGGTVGFFKWMFNGFEDDIFAGAEPLPEEVLPPERADD